MSAGNQVLDKKIVVCVDHDLADLIPGFLEHRWTDVQTLLKAMGAGDYATIGKVGHQMKGIGGGYGFDALSEIGNGLEQAAHQGMIVEEVRKLLLKLVYYLAHVKVNYA